MTKTAKNTLLSVIVLAAIAAVSVLILSLANAFFPKYRPTLNAETVALINVIAPSGVSNEVALSEKYYEMVEITEKKLDTFNKENGASTSNKVLAVYKAVKGDSMGAIIVESQAKGYTSNPEIVLLIAFNSDNLILDIAVKKQLENPTNPDANIFNADKFSKLREEVKGKSSVSASQIKSMTGSTATHSVRGVAECINLAAKMTAQQNPISKTLTSSKEAHYGY